MERKKIQEWNDFFVELENRKEKGVFFYRITGYNQQVQELIEQYYEAARRNGVVIEGRIANPDEKKLSYYYERMGSDFYMNVGFFSSAFQKWLPRVKEKQRKEMAVALYDVLDFFRKSGKNENMLKNAYMKYMCWLYYSFESILNRLGENEIPKILYEGEIGNYELMLFVMLSGVGCDIILLQYKGEEYYQKIDPASKWSDLWEAADLTEFPEGFCIRQIRKKKERQIKESKIQKEKPVIRNCTNAWITGTGFADIRTICSKRGDDPKLFYNCLIRISGVEDRLTYQNELYRFWMELKKEKRKVVIIEEQIPPPTIEEIAAVKRKEYTSPEQMLSDLAKNISYPANYELQKVMQNVFSEIFSEEGKQEKNRFSPNLNRLKNQAVYLLCWLKRYQSLLFVNWNMPEISCFFYLGGCKNQTEAMFCRLLSRLPVDVLILVPNLSDSCVLQDSCLYEIHYEESLELKQFPREDTAIRVATAAYYAEKELDTLMYQDSGMYRNQQYQKAVSVTLQTMYEEIAVLWKQELNYRPNFSILEGCVTMPVLFAKVSGIKDRAVSAYWSEIKTLLTEDTLLIKDVPYIKANDKNPVKGYATEFFKNKKLQKAKIKSHKSYAYGFLREEVQDYMLEKLQLLIEQKTIKGTWENGTEYTIISTVLNMNQDLLRMIQKFDFTKRNPKIVHINTTETMASLEDAILMAFLNLIGFDVVCFVPTGYQSIEKYFSYTLMEEYQIGEYMYDLKVPDFHLISKRPRRSWRDKLFKRGV